MLTRPERLDGIGLTAGEAGEVPDALAGVVEQVPLRFLWRPQLRDTDDEMVLETAVNGGAQRLATFNVRHPRRAARAFGMGAARPGVIWREVQGGGHEKK